jgi:hypothetical protein
MGATGPQGPAGAIGPQGPAGASGSQIQLTTEPPGANCPTGGERIDISVLGDGGLSSSQTAYVCNGISSSTVTTPGGADAGAAVDAQAGGVAFTIGGTLSGLLGGQSVKIRQTKGAAENLTLTSNGSFTFPTAVSTQSLYSVTVTDNTSGSFCAVSNGAGIVGTSNVNVVIFCSTPFVLAADQAFAGAIALDTTNVYWTSQPFAVKKVPLTGGEPIQIARDPNLVNGPGLIIPITVDATNVYWSDFGSIPSNGLLMTTPLQGAATGQLTVLESQLLNFASLAPSRVAFSQLHVYWANSNGVGGVLSMSGYVGPYISFDLASGSPVAMTVDATNAYWINSGDGSVMSVSLVNPGAPGVRLAVGPPEPNAIAADTTSVYWTNASEVLSVPLGGGSLAILVSGQANPGPVAVDDVNVYWINLGDGSLMKMPLVGGFPTVVVPGQFGATSIALDSTSIYWSVNAASGSVLKVDK